MHPNVSDSIAKQRMMNRRRADDQPATIERRLAEYHAEAEVVLKRNPRAITVDASGKPGEVWRRISQALDAGPPNAEPGR